MARTLAAAVVLATALTACGGGSDASVASYTKRDTSITVEAGDRFAIRLASNPTTGYEWKISKLPAPLQLVDSRRERPSESKPGTGETQVFELQALRAGDTSLELEYVRPFEPDDPGDTATFEIAIR